MASAIIQWKEAHRQDFKYEAGNPREHAGQGPGFSHVQEPEAASWARVSDNMTVPDL